MVKKAIIGLFIILGTTAGVWAFFLVKMPKVIQEKNDLEALIAGSLELERIWQEGDVEKKWRSGKYKCHLGESERVGDDYLRCNPNYLNCFLRNDAIVVEARGREYKIKARSHGKDFYQIIARSKDDGIMIPTYSVLVELVIDHRENKSLKVLLEDSCSETYLPQRIYGYGAYKKKGDWRWDNFGQHILVDKFQVSASNYKHFKKTEEEKLALPQTNLTLSQMKNYCAYRGKILMPAHIFDAAAFYPGDINNARPHANRRGPYPWSTRAATSFLQRARMSKDFFYESRYCTKVYSKECLQYFRPKGYDLGSVSWMGMYQVLGGVMEVHDNVIEENMNLMPSSYLFDASSIWHQLGKRAFWNGKDYFSSSFDWKDQDPVKLEPLIGFRCMRYVSEDY